MFPTAVLQRLLHLQTVEGKHAGLNATHPSPPAVPVQRRAPVRVLLRVPIPAVIRAQLPVRPVRPVREKPVRTRASRPAPGHAGMSVSTQKSIPHASGLPVMGVNKFLFFFFL